MELKKGDAERRQVEETANRDAAYERIYEHYGSDLAAFFRDVYKEVALRRRKLEPSSHIEKPDIMATS